MRQVVTNYFVQTLAVDASTLPQHVCKDYKERVKRTGKWYADDVDARVLALQLQVFIVQVNANLQDIEQDYSSLSPSPVEGAVSWPIVVVATNHDAGTGQVSASDHYELVLCNDSGVMPGGSRRGRGGVVGCPCGCGGCGGAVRVRRRRRGCAVGADAAFARPLGGCGGGVEWVAALAFRDLEVVRFDMEGCGDYDGDGGVAAWEAVKEAFRRQGAVSVPGRGGEGEEDEDGGEDWGGDGGHRSEDEDG